MRVTELSSDHVWKAAPGCRILVLDGGAVRFDVPRHWTIHARENHVLVFDEAPPNTRCTLGISWHRIPLEATGLSLTALLEQGSGSETRRVVQRGTITRILRPPLEIVWLQLLVFDESEQSEEFTRMCIARGGCTQAVILCEFGTKNEEQVFPVWQTLLSTLAVGEYIADPTTGRRYEQRG